MKAQQYVLDLAERAFFTFVQAFTAAMVVPDLSISGLKAAGLAGVAAVFALLKGLAAGVIGEKGSAAALPEPDRVYVPKNDDEG